MQRWTAKFSAAFHAFQSAAGRIARRRVKPTPFPEKNGGVPFNASGVVQVGARRFVFIDNHDSSAFFEFTLDADGEELERIRRRALVGVAAGQLGDPEGLCRVDVNGETFLIAASSLCVGVDRSGQQQVNDGLVRVRYTPAGDLHAEAMDGFRRWLLTHEPSLAVPGESEPDAGGLNIEGLAWHPRENALLFGQRGPATPGRIAIIQVPVDVGGSPWTTASLNGPSILRARIPQSSATQGIRDMCYDEDTGGFLILLGRSISRDNQPFRLCTWDGISDDVRLLDVTFHRSMKPEGITTFSRTDKNRILIVDDGGGYAVLRPREFQ